MPIYLDVSAAVHAKAGIGRYAASLARSLISLYPERFALFYNRRRGIQLLAGLEKAPVRTVWAGYKPWRMAVWIGHLARVGFDRLVPGAELFHATEHLLPPFQQIPTVLTVHDMIFKLFPQYQKRLNYWYLNMTMPLYCRRADAIITVSECSKRDIVQAYGVDAAKITVIYEAASPEFMPLPRDVIAEGRLRLGLPDRFLLHVGTIEPRKNLIGLIEALQQLHDRGLIIPLVVAGGKGWLYEEFFRRLETLPIRDNIRFLGYVSVNDLPLLYNAATALIMPSLYEGFGLPVLEGMACGTPVLCSNVSSLPEIAGEAACYFDPCSSKDIAEAIQKVWLDAGLGEEMKEKGRSRASEFSWERAARETMSLYTRLLSGNSFA
ncbi:MAG: glycosyltransferase family 4 protein [Anaerolineae bacterium]